MKVRFIQFFRKWKTDYLFKTVSVSVLSIFIGFVFTVYNGVLGILYKSVWNSSICVYYLLLTAIKAAIVRLYVTETADGEKEGAKLRKKAYVAIHILLFIMNLSLIVPALVMIKGGRDFTYGMIPAIVMATYTTYRITMSTIHFKKIQKYENISAVKLRTVNLIDSLVAVLSLQNALIIATDGMSKRMQNLSVWTSVGILILIMLMTVRSFLKIRSKNPKR